MTEMMVQSYLQAVLQVVSMELELTLLDPTH